MSMYRECKFIGGRCKKRDQTDRLCYQMGGKLGDGRFADCYRENSWWYDSLAYNIVMNVGRASANFAGGLVSLLPNYIIKGFIKAEDSETE